MSVAEILARHLTLPVHERLRGRSTMTRWRELRRNDHMDPDMLAALRRDKLQRLLAHCMDTVPWYREALRDAGIDDPCAVTPADLPRLPVLERDTLRTQGARLTAADRAGRLIRYSTGGSTGEPLVFATDLHRESCLNAQKLRARSWFGVHPGDRQVDFWGSPIELSRQNRLRRLKDRWLLNQVVLSASNLTAERIAAYCDFLHRFRPRLIYGYPTVIYRVAMHLLDHPRPGAPVRPALVACTSEMLQPHMRTAIRKAFGCPVANEYGSRDGGMIAHECPRGNLHIFAEQVIVEVDRPDADGVGDLLVTNLDGYGMPFIRYRIGDRGALTDAPCPCGLPLPRLGELQGRANDFLVGRDARMIHSSTANYVLREFPALRQYRLHQHPDHHFDLHMVLQRPLTAAERAGIREGLQRVVDEPVTVNLVEQDSIAPEPSGKYRWVVSEAQA